MKFETEKRRGTKKESTDQRKENEDHAIVGRNWEMAADKSARDFPVFVTGPEKGRFKGVVGDVVLFQDNGTPVG